MESWQALAVLIIGAAATQAYRFQSGLQKTIDALRVRLDEHDARLIECEKDRAALRQQISDSRGQ